MINFAGGRASRRSADLTQSLVLSNTENLDFMLSALRTCPNYKRITLERIEWKAGDEIRILVDGLWIALIILLAWITVERRWFADPVEPPDHPDDNEWW
ncbi:hypothetical protein CIG75_08150 [Tumebacillus algifaecis]|uniref:Uncharacterized protein n=1 Tax=Tumebacillus algifaecis TaxID=1214604 RepID=A0A223CZR0_9BACL|nr:hypothetical protein CIG75_08150 [Tumebacillus algifaecis]